MPDQRLEGLGQSQTTTKDAFLYSRNDPNGTAEHRKSPLTSFHTPLPGAMRLNGNVSASDTSISVRTESTTLSANLGWIVIDPFTTECEIRKVSNVGGNGATLNFSTGLNYAHAQDDAVLWTQAPVWNVQLFGAVGDGSTDDTSAIQAALDDVILSGFSSKPGSIVELPPGDYKVSSEILIPENVLLRGAGPGSGSCRIVADAGFTFGTDGDGLIRLGVDNDADATTDDNFGARVENIELNCSALSNSVGIVSDSANELSGVRNVQIFGWTRHAIWINNASAETAKNFLLEHIRAIADSSAPSSAVGIKIEGGDVTETRSIKGANDITIGASGAATLSACIELDHVGGQWSNTHLESATHGFHLGQTDGCPGLSITGITGHDALTHVVTIANNSENENIHVAGIELNGSTNAVNDLLNGVTLAQDLSWYATGDGSSGAGVYVADGRIYIASGNSAPALRLVDTGDSDYFDVDFARAGDTLRISSNTTTGIVTVFDTGEVGFEGLATENFLIEDAGSTGATEQDWVEVKVGGTTGYIRVYAAK